MSRVHHLLHSALRLLGVLLVMTALAGAQTGTPERLLVLLRDASALAIVDPMTGDEVGRVSTGRDPHEVTASADGRLAFVASMVDGISVIDLEARQEIRRVDPGPGSRTHDVLYHDGKVCTSRSRATSPSGATIRPPTRSTGRWASARRART